MTELLTKTIHDISYDDLLTLIQDQVPENEFIEYKRTLPCRNGSDPWFTEQKRIGDHAKQTILEEVVAFANSQGGILLVGIEESETDHNFAESIQPLPRCTELAKRFTLIFRDGVEPPLNNVEVKSIETEENDCGILLIRTEKSHSAPHRVKSTRECTVRRQDRCEKMSMREIQELTLNTIQTLDRVEKRFVERSSNFHRQFQRLSSPESAIGMRVTGLPLDTRTNLGRVFKNRQIDPNYSLPHVEVLRRNHIVHRMRNLIELNDGIYRPTLRGARRESNQTLNGSEKVVYDEILSDGLVELAFVATKDFVKDMNFEADWLLGLFIHTLGWIKKLRERTNIPRSSYAIQVAIQVQGLQIKLGPNDPAEQFNYDFGFRRSSENTKLSNIEFPICEFRVDDDPVDHLIQFQRDLHNWLAIDVSDAEEDFRIDR